MRYKKALTAIVILLLAAGVTGCATAPSREGRYSEQVKAEKENRAFIVQAIISFAGLAGGGAAGLLTAEKDNAVTSTITGVLLGGVLGFGAGYFVSENIKKAESEPPKPGDKDIDEYFREYENIKLMK